MPRLREVSRAEVTDERITFYYDAVFGKERDPVVEHGTESGTSGNWWTVHALSPEVFRHVTSGFALYRNARLDPVLRELGQSRAGWARGSQFVYSQHCKQLRALGTSEERIAAVPHWPVADCYSPIERTVLAYTDCLVLASGRVPDALFAELRSELDDEQILLFTYIISMYDMHATISRALRLEYDDVADRVVEVAAPEGFGNRDMTAVLDRS
ncbi:alkylhydroperoxidase family enzyme [Mycobacterium sp. MAA66]|uniref:carboxymuconolactone decarboxylase family protein n=1 Tax=Mycobacterium sp. MAA66 TaxID=3156297 RepID=UPI0035167EE5